MAKKTDKKKSIKKSSSKRKVTAVKKSASKIKAAPKKEMIKPKTESKNKLKVGTSKGETSEKDLFQDLTADSVFSFDAEETPKKAVLLAASDNLDDFDKEPVEGAEELDLVDEEADLGYDDEYDYDYEEDDDLGDDEEIDEELDDEEHDSDYDDEDDDEEKEEEDYKY